MKSIPKIDQDLLAVWINGPGIRLPEYCLVAQTSRSAVYRASKEGDVTLIKRGGRTFVEGKSAARALGLEHLISE